MSQALAQPYQQLKRAWDSRPQDLKKCGELLTQLKVISLALLLMGI